jgi:hypothetical protein
LHLLKVVAAINKMHMSVVKTGQQQLALCVEDLGLRTMPGVHLGAAADGYDAISQHCQSFCLRMALIHSPDFCIGDNQIGGGLALGLQ